MDNGQYFDTVFFLPHEINNAVRSFQDFAHFN